MDYYLGLTEKNAKVYARNAKVFYHKRHKEKQKKQSLTADSQIFFLQQRTLRFTQGAQRQINYEL